MARLKDLFTNFLDHDELGQIEFMRGYRDKRERDLKTLAIVKVKGTRSKTSNGTSTKGSKDKKVTVSKEQLAMLKALGLCG